MQTEWDGQMILPSNMLFEMDYRHMTVPLVLPDFGQISMRAHLPLDTAMVKIWPAAERIWFNLDQDLDPIPDPIGGSTVPATAFLDGGIAMPDRWTDYALPADSMPHILYLVSQERAPLVWIMALIPRGV